MLARALMVGHRRSQLRPLPTSRRRHLRAELLADVKAVQMVSNDINILDWLYRRLSISANQTDEPQGFRRLRT